MVHPHRGLLDEFGEGTSLELEFGPARSVNELELAQVVGKPYFVGNAVYQSRRAFLFLGECLLKVQGLCLELLAGGDVDYDNVEQPGFFLRDGTLKVRLEFLAAAPAHPQFTVLLFACLDDHFTQAVKYVHLIFDDHTAEGTAEDFVPGYAQLGRDGQVGLQNQFRLVHRTTADRGRFVEISIPHARRVEIGLFPPRLLVLHFQIDLVHAGFAEQFRQGLRRYRRNLSLRAAAYCTGKLSGPPAEMSG